MSGTEDDVIPPAFKPIDATHVLRIRLVRSTGKYPLLRREETLRITPTGPNITAVRAMVADHMMVSFAAGQAPAAAADAIAAAGGIAVRSQVHGSQVALLSFAYQSHEDYPKFQARLAALPGVRAAESDWVVQQIGTPDDAAFSQLWGMSNSGQTGGTADADIDAPEAWNISTGSKSVLVGVIDTGIDASHPDLAANMWTNPGESGVDAQGNDKRTNGIDDDSNGYMDDWRGWDFVNADNNPNDDHYHGTHCAGTIGGVGNNGAGVTGVCWQVSLVGLKFLSASGSGAISDAVAAQWYANAIGCDLTSNSWGGGGFSQAMKDAIDAAGTAGHLFVAAAGNAGVDNDTTPNYPSNIDSPNVIAVAATDHNDALASFSCYGAVTVDLGAPGVSIYSCQPAGLYQLLSGTSMATPHVAGACALLKAANPSLTGAQVKAAILANVDPIPALAGKTVTGGRLNVAKAVLAVSGPVISTTVAVVENGNGDGLLNPGEQAVITATCASVGSSTVQGVTGTLSLVAPDPAVQIEQAAVTYGDLAPGQTSAGSGAYRIRLAAGTPTPHLVSLVLTCAANDGGPWLTPMAITFVTTSQISGSVARVGSGAPIAGATVTWTGPRNGTTTTNAAGAYVALVPDGTYQVRASAAGLISSLPLSATVPPAAIVNFTLGAPTLAVSPTTLALTPAAPSGTVLISNAGDAPLTFAIAAPLSQTTSGLWHETSYRNATSGPGTSWYYGDETKRNYDTGSANSGALVFPDVQVPATAATFSCASWRLTESGSTWDASMVQVSTDGGLSWAALHVVEQVLQPRRDGLASGTDAGIASTWTTVLQDTDISGSWRQLTADLTPYAGQTVALRCWFNTVDSIANAYEGWYVDDLRVGGVPVAPWLAASPSTGTVAPGSSTNVLVTSNFNVVGGGTTTGTLTVSSNAPVGGVATVVVTMTKPAMANLQVVGIAVSDSSAPAIGDGDGDGSWEPGETVTIIPTWSNTGTAVASGVTTSVSTANSNVTLVAGTATVPDIAVGGQQAAAAPWQVLIKPTCPNNTVIPLSLVATDAAGVSWTGTAQITVAWKSKVSGVVRNGAGAAILGATISGPAGVLATSAADGSYSYANLSSGSITLTAAKTGMTSVSTTISTPPDATWNPVLSAPTIAVNPSSLTLSAAVGGTASVPMTVANQGDAPLNWSATIASGTDYVVATSDQAGGPTYNWVDISSTGTAVSMIGDDVNSGPIALGFTFPFYGQQFTTMRLCSNGWLSFTSASSVYTNTALPSTSAPENLIAFFWDDLYISSSSNVFYKQIDATTIVVQYQNVALLSDATKLLTCQVILRANGSMVFQYLRADVTNGCTVGIQNAAMNLGKQFAYNQALLHNNLAIAISPTSSLLSVSPTSGTVPPGGVANVTATMTAGTLNAGIYNLTLSVLSNDLITPAVTVPVTCTIISPPVLVCGTPTIIDNPPSPVIGDGDGKAEPGETIRWMVPVTNSGTISADNVLLTASTTSPYLTFPQGPAALGSVSGLQSVSAPIVVAIAANCPDGTVIPVTCQLTSPSGGPWTATLSLLVKWDCRISGLATIQGTGAPLVNAYVYVSNGSVSKSTYTAANGSFLISGLVPGSVTATISPSGYVSQTISATLPPDLVWNPVFVSRALTFNPTSIARTLSKGQQTTVPVALGNPGTADTTWQLSSKPSWMTLSPISGVVPAGGVVVASATLDATGLSNGVYSFNCYFSSNKSTSTSNYIPLTLTVRSANPPTAAPVSISMSEDGVASIQLLGADADGDALTYSLVGTAAHGTAVLGANGLVTYTPTALYSGSDAFTYRVSDGLDQSAVATVSITIAHVNHPPNAWSTVLRVPSGVTSTSALPVSDADLDALSITIVSPPRIGTLTVQGTQATYVPPAGFAGQDVCTISASDGQASSATVQVIWSVGSDVASAEWPTLGNGPEHRGYVPVSIGTGALTQRWQRIYGYTVEQVAVGDGRVYSTSRGGMVADASDVDAGSTLWTRTFPAGWTLNPPTYHEGSVFLQRGNHSGDSQLWRMNAANGATIWSAPYAEQWENHLAPTVSGNRIWINGGTYGGLYGFARDTGAQLFFAAKPQYDRWTPTLAGGEILSWAGSSLAGHNPDTGVAAWSTSTPVSATPYSQQGTAIADDQRIYCIANNYSYNSPGAALYAVSRSTHQIIWTRTGGFDGMPALADGHLFVHSTAGIEEIDAVTGASLRVYPMANLVAYSSTFGVQPIVTADAVMTASANETRIFQRGNTALQQSIPFGGALSLAGRRLYIAGTSVRCFNLGNSAPTATARSADVLQDETVSLALWGNDPDDQLVTWSVGAMPAHGTAVVSNGILVYTPAPGFSGVDSCTVVASDGSLTSVPATITVTVIPRPVAAPISVVALQGVPTAVVLSATNPRGLTLTYLSQSPAHGTLTGTGPNLSYLAPSDFIGTDTWTYTVSDGVTTSTPATVTVEVRVNLPPTVNPGTATTLTGEATTIGLVGADPEGLPISWSLAAPPTHGTATILGTVLTYTSASGFTGTDVCTVVATDGVRTSQPASMTLTVLPALIAQPVSVVTRQGVPVNVTLSANSPRGLPLTYSPAVPGNGTLVGSWPAGIYTPNPAFVGTDTSTYTVTDGISTSAPATITVVVKADLPSGWVNGDIGITGTLGTTYQDPISGTFIGAGGGLGQSGAADSGQSATRTIAGDCDVTARIPLPSTSSSTARVGILLRESADAGARSVFLGLSGAKRVVWSRRTTANANTTTSSYSVTAAMWVRLSRRGNVVWAYRSIDGIAWTLCGTTVMGMPDAMQAGTLVASGTAGVLLTASIESFDAAIPTPFVAGPIAINFQSGVNAPFILGGTTWSIADGAPYGMRWNGVIYGTSVVTTSTYNRNSTLSLDERYDTGLSSATSSLFEIGVPNGRYTVTVCVGDAASTSGKLYPEVEGIRAATGVASSATRWFTGTVEVDVLDGRLTLRCGSGATASRWAWVQIMPVPTPAGKG